MSALIDLHADVEKIEGARATWGFGHPHQLPATGQRVDHRGLPDVRSPREGDFARRIARVPFRRNRADHECRVNDFDGWHRVSWREEGGPRPWPFPPRSSGRLPSASLHNRTA